MDAVSRHLSELIDRPAAEVYAFAAEPANLPRWAAGLSGSIEFVDGRWRADSPMGAVTVEFAPRNDFGVLDHWVTLPTGETNYNPLRVLAAGDGSEVVFTLRRRAGVGDDDFEADAAAIRADLATLKKVLER
ncbi:SRPBCC family protein [Spongisporangium articulatum]|uniref:SRPBCC family protein n=1 Tax=Spongisporangium articulatum TaxID=3362603 RepID=A0ABW8ARG4_9ACTN